MEAIPNLTDWQISQRAFRQEVLERFDLLLKNRVSRGEAVRAVGVPEATLRDWLARYNKRKDWNDLIPGTSTGRRSALDKLTEQIGEKKVQQMLGVVQARNLEANTNSGAWRFASKTEPDFPPEAKALLPDGSRGNKHNIPRSLTEATKVTGVQRLAFQGRRALELNGSYTPRLMDVLPGDYFVPDDYTPTVGYWVPWPASERYPHGCKLMQGQLIGMVDYASLYRIAYALVAREHSSYRAADIWSFYGQVFSTVGLPRLGVQHEGGIWQANALRGVEIEYKRDEIDRQRRVGALTMLPTNILPYHRQMLGNEEPPSRLRIAHSILPKSKPIELAYSHMAKWEGVLWGFLGRDQRKVPIEKTKRLYEACRRGSENPRDHFMSYVDLQSRYDRLMDYLNDDFMQGSLRRGRPSELWNESVQTNPLYVLPAEMAYLYKRDFKVTKIGGAYLNLTYKEVGCDPTPLHYSNPEAFAGLDGQQIVVYYDRLAPEEDAHIVSPNGDYLCAAQYWCGTGAFLLKNPEGFDNATRYNSTVVGLTSIIAARASSREMPPEIIARRQQAGAERREADRTPFSAPRSGNLPAPATREPVAAGTLHRPRKTPAELLAYQPQVQSPVAEPVAAPTSRPRRALTAEQMLYHGMTPEEIAEAKGEAAPTRGRTLSQSELLTFGMSDDEIAAASSPPPSQEETPSGANRTGLLINTELNA